MDIIAGFNYKAFEHWLQGENVDPATIYDTTIEPILMKHFTEVVETKKSTKKDVVKLVFGDEQEQSCIEKPKAKRKSRKVVKDGKDTM